MHQQEFVILVNEKDEETGVLEKLEAHQKALLHRAFSVFVFNSRQEMLLQRRAFSKYHSPGLWTNTCCSHPRPGEAVAHAASRRLKEEMGLETPLSYKTQFIYKAPFDNGLTEHELDHVFTGITDTDPILNREEVEEFKWQSVAEVKTAIKQQPQQFTAWFIIAMDKIF